MTPGVSQAARSGWALVEAQFERGRAAGGAFLRVIRSDSARDAPGDVLALPVSMAGRVHELVLLPEGTVGTEWVAPGIDAALPSVSQIRPVGVIERIWRMWKRINDRFARLSPEQRQNLGLSRWRILVDLPAAYRVVTGFRWCIDYPDWIVQADTLRPTDASSILAHIRTFTRTPHFHVVVLDDGSSDAVTMTLESLRRQLYRNFACTILPTGGAGPISFDPDEPLDGVGIGSVRISHNRVDAALARIHECGGQGPGDQWLMLCRAGDALAPHALYWFAHEAIGHAEAAAIYCDDDGIDAQGSRTMPRFKPDWSLTHFRSHDFVGNSVALRLDAVAAVGGVDWQSNSSALFDVLLRVVDWADDAGRLSVRHLPALLFHRRLRQMAPSSEQAARECLESVRRHLQRNALDARVTETQPEVRRVTFRLNDPPPSVSVVIPTRDAVQTLRTCVESVLRRTDYAAYEVLIVDNQSETPEAQAYFAELAAANSPARRIRILTYDQPFNYSAINNFAVAHAAGEVICLLNNDTEVIATDWLAEMVGHLSQNGVGAVGAKLLYPDGRVQHAGDTVGPGGCANHLHAFIGRDDGGYCNRAVAAQELSAVTAACLVTRKDLYLRLGGLDEKNLPVAFNDVDFCLRVREAGLVVVWTPHAVLYHYESLTRGADQSRMRKRVARREVTYMRRRWKHVMSHDPFYNPNLSYERPDFSLNHAPRVRKPWLAK